MSEIKVAFVGCGRISDLHQKGYRNLRNARISAVCDTKKSRAQGKASQWNVEKVFTHYEDVLGDPEIDMIELLVPHHLHAPMVIDACKAGKHVSVQKPMALSIGDAQLMIDQAIKSSVALRVYENFIFYEPFIKAYKLVSNGEIGEPQMIRIHFSTGTRGNGWRIPLESWVWRFNQKQCGGGILTFDHGYHLFSIARFFMGEADKITAWIDKTPVIPGINVDAPATVMIKFKGNRRYGVMDFCHTPGLQIESDHYADDNRVEIIGDKGIILINRCTARTIDLPPLLLYKNGKTTPVPVEHDTWEDSFINCTRHFISVVQEGGKPLLDGNDAKAVLEMALAAQISAEQNREVSIDEVRKTTQKNNK